MDQEQNMIPKDDGFPTVMSTEKSNLSMFVGVGAFIIILVGLGWYIAQSGIPTANFTGKASPQTGVQNSLIVGKSSSTPDVATVQLETQGTSDDASAIQADLKATNLDSLGDISNI